MPALTLTLAPVQRDALARAIETQIKNLARHKAHAQTERGFDGLSTPVTPAEARYTLEIDRLSEMLATLAEVRPGELEVGEAIRTIFDVGQVFRVVEVSEDGLTVTARRFGVVGLAEEDRIVWFDLSVEGAATLRRVFGAAYTG